MQNPPHFELWVSVCLKPTCCRWWAFRSQFHTFYLFVLPLTHLCPTGQRVNRPSLDLGELRQVLQDEELAKRLQAEEEELLRGVRKSHHLACIIYRFLT